MENSAILQKKLGSIRRGAYWFGIVGRINIFLGSISFIIAILLFITVSPEPGPDSYSPVVKNLVNAAFPLITGWLFLIGRDAFEAIEALIKEVGDIV